MFNDGSSRTIRQIESVNNWVKNGCVGSIVLPTGMGKTNVGLMAIKRFQAKNPNKKIIVVAPNEVVKSQWELELKEENLIASVHTMYDTAKNKYKCALLVIDEEHKVMAPTLKSIFQNVEYKIILGLTATFERLDGGEEILRQKCPIVDEVSTEEAIKNGWLSDYKEYLVLIEPDDIEVYRELNRQFTEHFAYFQYNFPLAMKMSTNWKERINYTKRMSTEEKKIFMVHAMGFNRTLQKRKSYINSHPRKLELTNMILEHRKGKKCITFSATIAMAEKIKYGKVYSGKDSKKKGRITLQEFMAQKEGVINSIAKLSTGFNDPSLSVAVILGMNSSKTLKTQRNGRVLRICNGKSVEIFNLVIKGTVEEQWFRNSVGNGKYITIGEKDLINILENKPIVPKKNKETQMLFRF